MPPATTRFESLRRRGLFAALIFSLVLVGCGDSTGPGADLFFPTISAADIALYCIRGQAVPPRTVSGSITTTDCSDGGNGGYNDTFHVRVSNTGAVTFTVDSNGTFDSWLDLVRVADVGNIGGTTTHLESDDDSATGLDAEITYVLSPNTDYFVLVSGFDETETGSYTLRMAY